MILKSIKLAALHNGKDDTLCVGNLLEMQIKNRIKVLTYVGLHYISKMIFISADVSFVKYLVLFLRHKKATPHIAGKLTRQQTNKLKVRCIFKGSNAYCVNEWCLSVPAWVTFGSSMLLDCYTQGD